MAPPRLYFAHADETKKMPPPPSIARSALQIKTSDTPSVDLIWVIDRRVDDPHLMNLPSTHAPAAVDPVHQTIDPVYAFFNTKIIHYFWKITRALEFYKNTPKLFWNYIFVPIIYT
jgi:hypothetical protein